jgi:SAM-dependent methyltransferase
MVMQLEKVVPFGRSLDEYLKMFNLTPDALQQRILGVGDGPASFNAEATQQGGKITSVDPLYQFTAEEILRRFNEVVDPIIEQVRATPEDWVWSYHRSPEHLKHNRVTVMNRFVADYEHGKQAGRYRVGELPHLPFEADTYDLALCSHFLFLYSDHFDYEFHRASVQDMLRVSPEVRIFPLLTLMLARSPYLEPIMQDFEAQGYAVTVETVEYELQKGGNQMLVIRRDWGMLG